MRLAFVGNRRLAAVVALAFVAGIAAPSLAQQRPPKAGNPAGFTEVTDSGPRQIRPKSGQKVVQASPETGAAKVRRPRATGSVPVPSNDQTCHDLAAGCPTTIAAASN